MEVLKSQGAGHRSGQRLAYVTGMHTSASSGSGLRGRLWCHRFSARPSLIQVGHAPLGSIGRRVDRLSIFQPASAMSFDRLKRPRQRKRLPGHKLKPPRCHLLVQNSKPHLSMKQSYFLCLDAAKHKIRAALSDGAERMLFEKDLPLGRKACANCWPRSSSRSKNQSSCSCLLKLPESCIFTGRPRSPALVIAWP